MVIICEIKLIMQSLDASSLILSCNAVDPNPHGFEFDLDAPDTDRIHNGKADPDPDPGAWKFTKIYK
jgi:hypothetical protein